MEHRPLTYVLPAHVDTGCIVNTGAIIEHEVFVGEFTHISVNAVVAGRCKIGKCVMIGAGATIIDQIEIADDVLVGAGGLVCRSIKGNGTYVGVPVRKLN
ncbi:hypothetical protein FACS189441_7060 [Betaproteobacteria bacterium]|nr:hypothetical protein FACS189441_7060 [Betaproteobacteria bacterium]